MRRWPSGSSPRRGRCTSTKNWGWTCYRLRPGLDDHRSVPVGPVGASRTTKAAVNSTCGATFRVLSTSRMASCTTFMPSICSCRKPEPSTSWIVATSTLPAFMCGRGLLRHAGQVEHRCSSRLFGADGSLDRHHLRPDHLPGRLLHPRITPNFCGASAWPRVRQDAENQQLLASGRHHLRALQKPLAGGTLLQVDQAASSDQAVLRHAENAVKTQIWIAVSVYVLVAIVRPGRLALHFGDPLGDPLRENAHTSSTCGTKTDATLRKQQPIEFIRLLTGH